ncbi:MAG: enoyl-CoA hydratase/isomerase family protein [Burkholderiales bacterium]|nr:enoyl-CoA hydratase/isomerase family protein [Burkholderiales bacterium]
MDYHDYQRIVAARRGRILTLTLNAPDKLNAIDKRMHGELAEIFYDVAKDDACDVVVLTGAGKAFSAGGDLEFLSQFNDPPANEARRIVYGLLDLEKPVIARINGPAIGLGATVALFCDLAYASEDAKIGDPHVRIGLVAGDGGAFAWPELIGYMNAKRYLLTGDALSAPEAAQLGLINAAVPAEQLDEVVYGMAEKLARGAQKAIRGTKITINIGLRQRVNAVLDAGLAFESYSVRTAEHREGVSAFLEKRKPRFGEVGP